MEELVDAYQGYSAKIPDLESQLQPDRSLPEKLTDLQAELKSLELLKPSIDMIDEEVRELGVALKLSLENSTSSAG